MTRRIPSRPVLSAMLAVALLASLGLAGFSAPVAAAAGPQVGIAAIAGVTTADDGPSPRFGYSVLNQATTTVTKILQAVTPAGQPAGTAQQGSSVTYRVTISGLQRSGGTTESLLRDTFDSNVLTFIGGAAPAGTANNFGTTVNCQLTSANTVDCFVGTTPQNVLTGQPTATVTIDLTFEVRTTATPGNVATVETACARDATNSFTACDSTSLVVVNNPLINTATPTSVVATATPTRTNTPIATITSTATPTPVGGTGIVPLNVNVPGTTGNPQLLCAAVGQTCFAPMPGGGITFTITGSSTFTGTVTGPAGTLVGGIPAIFIPTNVGVEAFACGAVNAALQTTCTGNTVGTPLQGATITVRFPLLNGGTADVTGVVTGPGAPLAGVGLGQALINLPLLPPPPLQFIPPPPPPLLPPPPPAPMQGAGMMRPPAGFPDVPVIPEADSIVLLVGGLAALGGVVVYRRRRSE